MENQVLNLIAELATTVPTWYQGEESVDYYVGYENALYDLKQKIEKQTTMKNKTYYYLFGSEAVNAYVAGQHLDITEAGLYKYVDGENIPHQLLDAFQGWSTWCEITEQDYIGFKQEQDGRD